VSPLSPLPRLAGALVAFGALYLAGPGIVTADGLWPLAVLALCVWALVASRPGRRAFLVEWAAGSLGWALILSWAGYVWWGTLLWMGPGMGVYMACAGWVLRRLARRLPLGLAAPLAWVGVEALRAVLPAPFGNEWMRLGTHLHAAAWIAGSARVWGFLGLSFAIAALGGLLAALWNARGRTSSASLAAGLGPFALGVALALAVPPPEVRDGPRVLLVQPSFAQARKMEPRHAADLFAEALELTRLGVQEAQRAGEPAPDLVAWGETMLPVPLPEPGLAAALARGARPPSWWDSELTPEDIALIEGVLRRWVGRELLGLPPGRGGALPPGSVFVSGVEHLLAREGAVRRQNAIALWDARGEACPAAAKRELVPGAETMLGLERFSGVRSTIYALAGYVPDLFAAERTGVLSFATRTGERYAFGASVCYDNAFDCPYTEPLREGPLDFHLVVSNEAWFRSSQEMDQMVAFSHLIAIQTGRSVVRATNAGVTVVIAPDGSEVARLRVGGRDREVGGTLRATVPVPAAAGTGTDGAWAITPFVRLERVWRALWLLLPAAALAWTLRPATGNRRERRGRGSRAADSAPPGRPSGP
jgi:apolipoprotein N-acyltransferase